MLRVLDLFSGIGGFSLGLERTGGFKTVAFCEIEPFPRRVLAKHWPGVFIHDDIRTLTKDTLCKGYAENALLNQLCKEMGGGSVSVRDVITSIKKHSERRTHPATTSGPLNAEEALLTIMAGNVPAAENESTHFWRLITNLITEATSDQNTRVLYGNSLSSADFLTIIRFFVITATWQNQLTVPAHINETLNVPCYHDIRELTAARLAADGVGVDVICGGFPCTDISVAGRGAGIKGKDSGLWSEFARLIGELRPCYAIVENVSALLSRGLADVLGDLAALGYSCRWDCIPASAVGAPHRRDRIWIISHANGERCEWIGFPQYTGQQGTSWNQSDGCGEGRRREGANVPDANGSRRIEQWRGLPIREELIAAQCGDWWLVEPDVGRVANGVPSRVDRLKGLGNALVPQIPELIGRAILAASMGEP